jgi:hypothetical protein
MNSLELILFGVDIGIALTSCSSLARMFATIGIIMFFIDFYFKGII